MPPEPFQKESIYLKKLPYYSQLQSEADYQLSVIKAGLGYSVLLRDIRPSLLHWVCELDKYIYLYGWRFSKEDHIIFIKILYQLVIMPDLEFRMVKTLVRLLTLLLDKKELLSRHDLQLDWRPLYNIYVFLTYKELEEDGLLLLPQDMQSTFEQLIRLARIYFPANVTQEMLDEFRPHFCPWDMSFVRGIACYNLFLPTYVTKEELGSSVDLWIKELIFWWLNIQNCPPWEQKIVGLLARTARDNIGRIDWNPYLPEMFTKILRYFGLSIVSGEKKEKVDIGHNVWQAADLELVAILLANLLGGTSQAQDYLTRLFQALESYYHPSNVGTWTEKLMYFLHRLPLNVCLRVHKERTKKPSVIAPIPDDWKLTDTNLDDFVSVLLPSALSALFAKMRSDSAASAIRCLAQLSPSRVVPAVLERVNSSFDTLTEPHRLLQSLSSLAGVVLPVLRPKWKCGMDDDPRLQVISLLVAALPGIDPNDAAKSMVTFQILSLFGVLVPMVDSSDAGRALEDITPVEKELASASASLEDFVSQFIDKILNLVENSAVSHTYGVSARRRSVGIAGRFSPEEAALKSGMYSSLRAILANCSTEIYKLAFNKMLAFINDTVLEGRVAAEMVGELCYAFCRTHPKLSLPVFLAILKEKMTVLITEDLYKEDEINDSVMWYLTILCQIVRTDGAVLVEHRDDVLKLLLLVRPLKAKEAYENLAQALEHLLTALCATYTNNFDSDREMLDKPPDEYFPIRHWAEPCDLDRTPLVWHIPSEAELNFTAEVMEAFIFAETKRFEAPEQLSKEEMLKSLSLIKGCLAGASYVLPWLDGEDLKLVDTEVPPTPFSYRISVADDVINYKGENVRRLVYLRTHKLMEHLLTRGEEDPKPLAAIGRLYSLLLFHRGMYKARYDSQSKGLQMAKQILTDKVLGKRSHPKPMVLELSFMQHNKRLLEKPSYYFTKTHLAVMKDLVKLSTSSYSEVRKEGQRVLDACFTTFPYSYKHVLDEIVQLLAFDAAVNHEQFKGALYILLSNKKRSLCVRNDWETLGRIWPPIVKAQHSEKPSIIQLLDALHNCIVDNLESFQIKTTTSVECIAVAEQIWSADAIAKGATKPAWPLPSSEARAKAAAKETAKNNANESAYLKLIDFLVELSSDHSLHWRHEDMAQSFLSLMLRLDARVPHNAVSVFVRLLNHDSMKTRKLAVAFLGAILKLVKPKAKTLIVSSKEIAEKAAKRDAAGTNSPAKSFTGPGARWQEKSLLIDVSDKLVEERPIPWGFRHDNNWLQYAKSAIPTSSKEWNETWFVDKTHWGFYCWPKQLVLHMPFTDANSLVKKPTDLLAEERPIYEFFTDDVTVTKFIELLSVEEKKGEDQFHTTNFALFRGLFRNFGNAFLPTFKPHIERLAKSTKDNEQRVAAEFIAGVVQGSKRWPFEMIEDLWAWLDPVITAALDNVTNETYKDWGSCVATAFDSRDPRKLHWFIKALFRLAKRPVEASFSTACRFFFLQGGINQLEWRVMELWKKMYDLIQPLLVQPYQNLRDRLGSCLSTIFWFDMPGATASGLEPIRRATFLQQVSDDIALLWSETEASNPDETKTLSSIRSAPNLQQLLNGTITPASLKHEKDLDCGPVKNPVVASLSATQNALLAPPPSGEQMGRQISSSASNPNFRKLRASTGSNGSILDLEDTERKDSILLLKTVLCYFASHWNHSYCTAPPEILQFLPLLAYFENETSDEELKRDCHFQLLHGMARGLLHRENVPVLVELCQKTAQMNWWKARVSLIHFLRVSAFSNLFLLSAEQRKALCDILFVMLKDVQIEVRQAASETLSGFLHCGFITLDESLIKLFRDWAKSPQASLRHAGVLGLSAIVQAAPYSVPPHLPEALMALSAHANEKQPIQATVKKALSEFKRTHHDNWHEHKKFFDEDELLVLTDLLVSPNYYV